MSKKAANFKGKLWETTRISKLDWFIGSKIWQIYPIRTWGLLVHCSLFTVFFPSHLYNAKTSDVLGTQARSSMARFMARSGKVICDLCYKIHRPRGSLKWDDVSLQSILLLPAKDSVHSVFHNEWQNVFICSTKLKHVTGIVWIVYSFSVVLSSVLRNAALYAIILHI